MRYQPDKKAIIIDQVGNFERFGLPDQEREWTLKDREKTPHRENTNEGIAIKTCPKCFAVIEASLTTCPICGHDFTPEIRELEQKREQELQKIEAERINRRNIANKKVSELTSFKELAIYGKARGFKPGWAWHMAKRKGFI